MPELPEVTAIANFLDERTAGLPIRRVDIASLAVLKTADPPYTALAGRTVTSVGRIGKYLVITTASADDSEPLHLVIHLSRAGWVRWSENLSPKPPRPGGKGPIAVRVHCGLPGEGFDVTEAGTQKRLAVWVVTDPLDVERIAGLGPDALSLGRDELAQILAGSTARIKNLLTDQRVIAGIGNAYSDEILHRARLSPFATSKGLSDDQIDALYESIGAILRDAAQRLEGPGGVSTMKAEKRSGLQVHARTGLPCPVCGDTVAEVSFADRSFQYCPTCQTGGKKLADRRMSRLLK
ncbi:putative DNA glycosylase [Gordonia araii NBRC 100433]|uniref:Putative DNA glycosylase n=1 Tax=Gordonia araii NBRC 100433 TaxID=1073574 RepID=G7H3H2_9ACTN|nr:DNA-formamidopyrimidine glycosylase family protein [Gordonia araii]NNG96515.1 Fpg/Nei family DNA glycosylase [Gordonia araii NBRC 100433]GAB10397.1 putative DNA glycosylase [Gordonia araii NBRC 100433]